MLDDGSLTLVRRPAPARPTPFSKRVALPADAEVGRATTEPLGEHGMLVCVPRIVRRRSNEASAPRKIPVNGRPPPPQAHSQPAPAPPAKRPVAKPAAKPQPRRSQAGSKDVSTTELPPARRPTRQHDAENTTEKCGLRESLQSRSAMLDDGAGPVLTEVSASSRNVQAPTEPVEEWLATTKGGFVRSADGSALSEKMRRESRVAAAAAEEEERRAARDEHTGQTKRFKPLEEELTEPVTEPAAEDEWVAVERAEAMEEAEAGERAEAMEDEEADDLAYWGF